MSKSKGAEALARERPAAADLLAPSRLLKLDCAEGPEIAVTAVELAPILSGAHGEVADKVRFVALRNVPDRFAVAFSLAGEQRELVLPIAQEVESILGSSQVFYDLWYEHWTAGWDADLLLQNLYTKRAELVVVCVSAEYGTKSWTQAEHRAIRAETMKVGGESARLRVLPLRVGDGDIAGVLFNDLVPEVRGKATREVAELIVARLNLVRGGPGDTGSEGAQWPEHVPELTWPMADHSVARTTFATLLQRSSEERVLLIQGVSETGKTHMSRQMARSAGSVPGVRCGRFDFKGTTDVDVELEAFTHVLDVDLPQGQTLAERLGHVLVQLRRRAQPTLLVFDTYEAAGAASAWVEGVLLSSLINWTWLRVVLIGQSVPSRLDTMWEFVAAPPTVLQPPGPQDWLDYGKAFRDPSLELSFVTQAHTLVGGKASLLAQLLGPAS